MFKASSCLLASPTTTPLAHTVFGSLSCLLITSLFWRFLTLMCLKAMTLKLRIQQSGFEEGDAKKIEELSSVGTERVLQSAGDVSKGQQSSQDGHFKQVVVQEQSTKMEIAKVFNSAKRSADSSSQSSPPSTSLLLLPGALPPGNNAITSISSSLQKENFNPSSNPSSVMEETTRSSPHSTETPAVSPETQQSVLDACPHDVLYISDLITFSSRFCGSNRPPSSQLVFGSNQEMVEVIMELITTTHWGRGFALLFHYHNLTKPWSSQHDMSPSGNKIDSLLAAVSGAAFFALILTSVLCIIFR